MPVWPNPGVQQRPTQAELSKKLRAGAALLAAGTYAWVYEPEEGLYDDLDELGLITEQEIAAGLATAFREVRPSDYEGPRPPLRSNHRKILQCEMFSFVWASKDLGCNVYLKFAIENDWLWLVSFHKSRPERRKRKGTAGR